MKKRVSFRPERILILQLIAMAMIPISLMLLLSIDGIVNGDLYNYGLSFNDVWAARYQTYKSMAIAFILLFAVATGASIFTMLHYKRRASPISKGIGLLLMVAGILFILASMICVLRIDTVVHHDLYDFGLQFSNAWAIKYWNFAGFLLALESESAVMLALASIWIALSTKEQIEISPMRLAGPTMLLAGALLLALSILYSSVTPAFIGLGLIFWGSILLYIRSPNIKQTELIEAALTPSLSALYQLIRELGFSGQAIYLPPRYFGDLETTKILISRQKGDRLPTPSQVQDQEHQPLNAESPALLLKPPGAELVRLFEKTLNTNFTKTDLIYVQRILPRLLIEDLEIAEKVKIETAISTIRVAIENTVFTNLHAKTPDIDDNSHLGSVLTSAIACALAKATGKPIAITNEQTIPSGRATNVEYTIIEENEKEQPQ
jgi:hypothetical protein